MSRLPSPATSTGTVRPTGALREKLSNPQRRAHPRAIRQLVVACGMPDDVLCDMREAWRTRGDIRPASSVTAVRAELNGASDACVVIAVPAAPGDGFLDALLLLRRDFPSVPLLALAIVGRSSLQGAWGLGRAEVSELITVSGRLDADDFRIALARAHADGVIARVWNSARLHLPDPLVTIIRRAIRLAHKPLTAADLAQTSQLHERSLRKYCTRHLLPSPQELVGWTRLLVAAYYLDEPGRALHQVAEILGFPTPDALRKLIARYTGRTSSALRAVGALEYVARRFETRVASHRAPTIQRPLLTALDEDPERHLGRVRTHGSSLPFPTTELL